MNFLEIQETPDFSWLENWQRASAKSSVIVDLDLIDSIKNESWPLENMSLGESLSAVAYLSELKDIDISLPLGLDSIVWTNDGLKIIPSEHPLRNREVRDFANKVAIDVISKWKQTSPLLKTIFKKLQSEGLEGLTDIFSAERLKQWKLLRPIIPSYMEMMVSEMLSSREGNTITFTGIEGEGERLIISALIKKLRKSDYVVITIDGSGSYSGIVRSLLESLIKLVPRNQIRAILPLYDGNVGRILSKYTNIPYTGPSGIMIPQMEGHWISLTAEEILKLIKKPVAIIFENYIESARKNDLWDALSTLQNGLFVKHDKNGIPVLPLMDPEELREILIYLDSKEYDPVEIYRLAEGKTSTAITIIRLLKFLQVSPSNIPASKDELLDILKARIGNTTVRLIAAAFGSNHTEIPASLLRSVNEYTDIVNIVSSGLIDLYNNIATIADSRLITIDISEDELLRLKRTLISQSGLSLSVVYHLLDDMDSLSGDEHITLLKISGALLHHLRNENLLEALELAWEMEKRFGELLIEHPRYYLLIGQVFMLNGRRERGYEIFSAVKMFTGSTPWILSHILYYSFPMLTNGIGWEEAYNELKNLYTEDIFPCMEFLILDSMTRYEIRTGKNIPAERIEKIHRLYKGCSSQVEHTFRYRDLLMSIYEQEKKYAHALSEAIKLKDTFTEKEPYLLAYGMFKTGLYLIMSGENLWLALYYLERAFEYFVYFYNVEAFLAIGLTIQWKAQMLPRHEFEQYINTILALIELEGLILYDRDYVYLSIALAYHLYGEAGIANGFLSMVSEEVVFESGGDITGASRNLFMLLTGMSSSERDKDFYSLAMANYVPSDMLPSSPHLIVADMIKGGIREVKNKTDVLTKLAKDLYKHGFKLLTAFVHALIGKSIITGAREIANFHLRRSKHLFNLLESKWADRVLEEIEMSDPFYALAIKTALEVEKGININTSDATELIEMFVETIRILQTENEILEQIITLVDSFTETDNAYSAGLYFISSALTIWGASRGWLYLEKNGIPKLWIHTNIQGTDEEEFLLMPMSLKDNVLSENGNFIGVIASDGDMTLKIYIESTQDNTFNRNHIFILTRSGETLLHFLKTHIK